MLIMMELTAPDGCQWGLVKWTVNGFGRGANANSVGNPNLQLKMEFVSDRLCGSLLRFPAM